MAVQRHVVVIPRKDGGVEIHPMKAWLKAHPEYMPAQLDPDPGNSTSHQLRAALCKQGWTMEETPAEIRLLAPGTEDQVELGAVLGASEEPSNEEALGFSLEYQLRDFLAANLQTIDVGGHHLVPYQGNGVEYATSVGFIDILAIDKAGDFFVFELKRANSHDSAMGQLMRYMGWVKQNIGMDKNVYGIIVSKTVSEKLRYARSVVPNVFLFEYEVSFSLKQAHNLA